MAMDTHAGGAAGEEVMVEMNMTPLIDVMLVLIIMLIITIPIQNHAVNLSLPTGRPPPARILPAMVTIDIDPGGSLFWNGQPLADRAMLEQKLREIAAAVPEQPEVHLRPDRRVAYREVAAVMASAQRLGVNRIGLVGNEQFAR